MFWKKGVLKSNAKFTGKPLRQVFSCENCEIVKNTFIYLPLVKLEPSL